MKRIINDVFITNRPPLYSNPPVLQIYDNFFPSYLTNNLEALIYQTPFMYQRELTTNLLSSDNKDYAFSKNLFDDHKKENISPLLFPFLEPLYFFTTKNKLNIKNISNARLFLQPPSLHPGPQEIHIDQNEAHMVFLYYISDSDGDTYFYNDKGEVIKQVSPKKGRIVWFDGSYYHCGSRPESNARIILNINLTLNHQN